MTGQQLRNGRQRMGWTQQRAAKRLGVSQAYLSMVEGNRRRVPLRLTRKLLRTYDLPVTALPVQDASGGPFNPQELAGVLGALRYPGFAYLRDDAPHMNPASVLLQALRQPCLEPRLAMALPWVAYEYSNLDWNWLVQRAKSCDLQNRLGFVVTLARRLAERHNHLDRAVKLARVEASLEHARLVREDTFCRDSLTNAERRWFRDRRPDDAKHWNLLTNVDAEHLANVD
jgi:transcriptional regulator with XRE-family HTH domain